MDIERHTFRSPAFRSVVEEAIAFFEGTPAYELPPPGRFVGCGVYALYYRGGYELYAGGPAQPGRLCSTNLRGQSHATRLACGASIRHGKRLAVWPAAGAREEHPADPKPGYLRFSLPLHDPSGYGRRPDRAGGGGADPQIPTA